LNEKLREVEEQRKQAENQLQMNLHAVIKGMIANNRTKKLQSIFHFVATLVVITNSSVNAL